MIFKGEETKGDLNGFLDAGSNMSGELNFEDTFRVDGKLTGKVSSKGDLVVGERGVVDGEISVSRVYVSGTLKGKVKAAQRIEITAGGRLLGDIQTPTLVIEEGGFYEGHCTMESGAAKQDPAVPSAGVVTPIKASGETGRSG
jgi:cytoskeletal protein CcmA (bactofilin family)